MAEEEFVPLASILGDNTPKENSANILNIVRSWGEFVMVMIYPALPAFEKPKLLLPEDLGDGEFEFVYPIYDRGTSLATSKAQDVFCNDGLCKVNFTIEKMIDIFYQRIKQQNIDEGRSLEMLFYGLPELQRKAFESLINLEFNVVVNNFEPGEWGDNYIDMVRKMEEQGYGYPSKSPRKNYRNSYKKKIPINKKF
jgi:hypothetical protein